MNKRILLTGLCICLCLLTVNLALAQDQPAAAIFNNTRIYLTDIQLSDSLRARKEQELSPREFNRYEFLYRMMTLAYQIHQLILDRVLTENNYELTDKEFNAYLDYLKTMKKNPYTTVDDQKKLQIKADIKTWHFNSIIYNKYKGAVLSTPQGFKPVEAYKKLIDELLETNVLIIPDIMSRGVLEILYTYFEDRNENYIKDPVKIGSYFQRPDWGDFGSGVKKDPREILEARKKFRQDSEQEDQDQP